MSDSQRKDDEQQFTIQPHPQTSHSNTQEPNQPTSSLQGALAGNPGPVVVDGQTASKLETPKGGYRAPVCSL